MCWWYHIITYNLTLLNTRVGFRLTSFENIIKHLSNLVYLYAYLPRCILNWKKKVYLNECERLGRLIFHYVLLLLLLDVLKYVLAFNTRIWSKLFSKYRQRILYTRKITMSRVLLLLLFVFAAFFFQRFDSTFWWFTVLWSNSITNGKVEMDILWIEMFFVLCLSGNKSFCMLNELSHLSYGKLGYLVDSCDDQRKCL